ncbi:MULTISPECIES: hypothetical protein [unclassified Pseudomonas]|uniref:hypothetical protein n=1 Tax=unclassified Pseudomonas TaxID=196821 RepID=UPI002449FEBB|nr:MULTISPECIES: hypothetical protein [unclassified Pseudomonas]MDG9931036.1 hypothetical protein [Pseudomonas sp. GD04042]MDH0485529.1 hypothetical protein [Pseudomonas sp. GD04015]MDH0606675.1 hypothetical protein [Pseudomonas sp. GD03869]
MTKLLDWYFSIKDKALCETQHSLSFSINYDGVKGLQTLQQYKISDIDGVIRIAKVSNFAPASHHVAVVHEGEGAVIHLRLNAGERLVSNMFFIATSMLLLAVLIVSLILSFRGEFASAALMLVVMLLGLVPILVLYLVSRISLFFSDVQAIYKVLLDSEGALLD